MKSHPGVAATVFETLAANNINIEMIATSAIRVSCVVAEADVQRAVVALHDAFGLAAVSALDAAIRARGSRPGAVHFANPSFALALGAVLRGADIKLAPGQVPPQALNEVWSMIT